MDPQHLYDKLSEFITENKRQLFERIAAQRTRQITVVLEDIFQPHNASAVLRTCDLMGVQDVHVIESRNTYSPNPQVALGAQKWLDIHHYGGPDKSATTCVQELRSRGYRIVATALSDNAVPLPELPIDGPLAICFGTELTGLSEDLLKEADVHLQIPMHGFTESYNISVSVAIVLYEVMKSLRTSSASWRLSEEEQLDLKIQWTRRMLRNAEELEQRIRNKVEEE